MPTLQSRDKINLDNSYILHIFVMLTTYTMNQEGNIIVPKVNESLPCGVGCKPFTVGTFYFLLNMKEIIVKTKATNNSGIYVIQSQKNKKGYIGSAINLRKRKYEHFNNLENKNHINKHLQNHYNKYDQNDLIFSIIEFCSKEELIEKEQYWIDTFNPEFNILPIARSSLAINNPKKKSKKIRVFSAYHRRKISEANKIWHQNNPNKKNGTICWEKKQRQFFLQNYNARITYRCKYCGIDCAPGLYAQWHGEKCKENGMHNE